MAAVLLAMHGSPPNAAVGPAAAEPADWTPQMVAPAGAGYVRQLTLSDGTMFAVATFAQFTSPADGGATFSRNNAISFTGRPARSPSSTRTPTASSTRSPTLRTSDFPDPHRRRYP
jgi:hypothetical protein